MIFYIYTIKFDWVFLGGVQWLTGMWHEKNSSVGGQNLKRKCDWRTKNKTD
jgi:hypothetical protein